jgi:phage shock protein PspC (stress-responsive transcriptional regulator)
MSTTHATHEGTRRLVRSGIADYTGVDVTVIRLAAVIGAVLGFGTLIVAYVVAWLLMPEA